MNLGIGIFQKPLRVENPDNKYHLEHLLNM